MDYGLADERLYKRAHNSGSKSQREKKRRKKLAEKDVLFGKENKFDLLSSKQKQTFKLEVVWRTGLWYFWAEISCECAGPLLEILNPRSSRRALTH